MADDFARLVSQANPAASQYLPTYPPSSANNGLDPFFDDDDDVELGTPTPHARRGANILSPDAPPDSAFGMSQAMRSTDSGLPLSKNAAPPAGTGEPHVWGFDDEDVQLPSTFEGSASFPGVTPHPQPKKSPRKQSRTWRWPWQKEERQDGERVIALNDEHANLAEGYCSNYVSTSKYNLATFLPKFLTGTSFSLHCLLCLMFHPEQFSKYANIFFLFTACIQQIPGVSPTNQYTTIVPLGLVLLASAFKEVSEDIKRHQSDKELNARRAKVSLRTSYVVHLFTFQQVLSRSGTGTFIDIPWRDIRVGDVVRIESDEFIPADVVLISSSEPEGLCYIETSNLDGYASSTVSRAYCIHIFATQRD